MVLENDRRTWWNSANGIAQRLGDKCVHLDIRWWVLLHKLFALLDALLQLGQALLDGVHL